MADWKNAWKQGAAEDDLSEEALGSLTAGGMLAGGVAGNETAQTAEGSVPSEPLPGREDPDAQADPVARPESYRRLVRRQS